MTTTPPNEIEWIIGSAFALILFFLVIWFFKKKSDSNYEHSRARIEQTEKCESKHKDNNGLMTFMN